MLMTSPVFGLVMVCAAAANKRTPSVASTAARHSLNATGFSSALSMCKSYAMTVRDDA
jgi:hypothetical protein